eukprot:5959701-Lingulodinium_polyedra.AAC.1
MGEPAPLAPRSALGDAASASPDHGDRTLTRRVGRRLPEWSLLANRRPAKMLGAKNAYALPRTTAEAELAA